MTRLYSSLANPDYGTTAFTDFASINTQTRLEKLDLNWREKDLPERARTKHVHRLHPYLGKFIPQLAEIFLRKFARKAVCDPFCGSGTTLVEAKVLGLDSVGVDISEFNCLLSRVKTETYDLSVLESEIRDILTRLNLVLDSSLFIGRNGFSTNNQYLKTWFHPQALEELLAFRELIPHYQYSDVMRVILSRAARSARLTTHFELDFPKRPATQPYECRKHNKVCRPTDDALQFLNRYALDTLVRIRDYARKQTEERAIIICGDSRLERVPFMVDTIITSPPYVGLIDYHEQHRYAYELLGFPWRAEKEIGPASSGSSAEAKKRYLTGIIEAFRNCLHFMRTGGTVVVIANDQHHLYESLHDELELKFISKLERHVNRRTGRRMGDFFEQIYIWKKE